MFPLKQIERFLSLHKLIKNECTGTSENLASILHINRRCVFNYMEELRLLGASISYDWKKASYYYENDFDIKFIFEVNVSEREINKKSGTTGKVR